MSRVQYNGIMFDSELEVNYYKHLEDLQFKGEIISFIYHPVQIADFLGTRSYTPDFIVEYPYRIEIIETKGYNQFSFRIDEQIHNMMLSKDEEWLRRYAEINWFKTTGKHVIYKKIKHLAKYGWVDFDFKNPNTLANQRKAKLVEKEKELKQLKEMNKKYLRYIQYTRKNKLTKAQSKWKEDFEKELNEILLHTS